MLSGVTSVMALTVASGRTADDRCRPGREPAFPLLLKGKPGETRGRNATGPSPPEGQPSRQEIRREGRRGHEADLREWGTLARADRQPAPEAWSSHAAGRPDPAATAHAAHAGGGLVDRPVVPLHLRDRRRPGRHGTGARRAGRPGPGRI